MKAQRFLRWWAALSLLALLMGAAGCAAPPAATPMAPPAAPPTATSFPGRTETPDIDVTPTSPQPTGVIVLTWWTPEFLSPKAAQHAGPLLAEQLAAFEDSQQGKVTVNAVLKARYGKGGLLDFLRTAQPVAPAVLPDLVALDVIELEVAAAAGLLQPLDGLLAPELLAGLYPFATANGQFGNRLLAVQLIADVEHIVYTEDQAARPPATWSALINGRLPYLFPIAGVSAGSVARPQEALTHAVISQYLSAGASQDPASRGLRVEAQPLTRLLAFYAEATRSGLLPPAALEVGDSETVWSVYTQSRVPFAYVSGRHYLAERDMSQEVNYAAAPGYAAPARSLADGWALAIVTTDPARQRAAAALINWLLQPQHAAALARAVSWLPTSPEALAAWGADPYLSFLNEHLATAIPHPIGADYTQAAGRIQRAVISVVKSEASPEQAVEAALAP